MDDAKTPWDNGVPPHLLPALEALRKRFDDAHWKVGRLTQVLGFALLHGESLEELSDYLPPLRQLKILVGLPATQRFIRQITAATAPAIFKGFFDLYLEGLREETVKIFQQMLKIADANESEIGISPLQWASSQVEHMIQEKAYSVESWVREVCDKQVLDPAEADSDEWIFWSKWQAPYFLVMKSAGPQPYEAAREWERQDAATSSRWVKHFSNQYEIFLRSRLEVVIGEATVEAAKQPRQPNTPQARRQEPMSTGSEVGEPSLSESRSTESVGEARTVPNANREKQKRKTQKLHAGWAKQLVALKQSNPGKSDVWYSRKIATMPIAQGAQPETIRRNMK